MSEDIVDNYIMINTKKGLKKRAELVSKFEIPTLGEYIIYKLDGKFYGAKYKLDENEQIVLDDFDENTEKEAEDAISGKMEFDNTQNLSDEDELSSSIMEAPTPARVADEENKS